MSSFLSFLNETILQPAWSAAISKVAGHASASIGQEIQARLLARFGQPGNHDIERAMRVAQFQALELVVEHYAKLVAAMPAHEAIDPDQEPQAFIKAARDFINREFRLSLAVKLNRELAKAAFSNLNQDIVIAAGIGAAGQPFDERAKQVEEELRQNTGRDTLPPIFLRIFRGDREPGLSWLNGYRAFLCEQVKTNPRFSSILVAATLAGLKADGQETSKALEQQLRDGFDRIVTEQRQQFGDLGRKLEQLEAQIGNFASFQASFGAIERRLIELLEHPDRAANLQSVLDQAYAHIGQEAFTQSVRVIEVLQAQPFIGRADDLAALTAFVEKEDRGLILLSAAAGIGKSRLLAHWSAGLAGPDCIVLRHFFSVHQRDTANAEDMRCSLARQAVLQLGAANLGGGVPGGAPGDFRDRLSRLLGQDRPAQQRLVVVLDGLDEAIELIAPLTTGQLGRGVFLVVSGRAEAHEEPIFLRAWRQQHQRPQGPFTERQLASMPPKDIADWIAFALAEPVAADDPRVRAAWQASEGIPLFIRFLVPDAIEKLRAGQDVDTAFPASFNKYAEQEYQALENAAYGKTMAAQAQALFGLLALAKAPLAASDIQALTGTIPNLTGMDSRFARWFRVTPAGQELQAGFAHPRLARVFRTILDETHQLAALRESLLDYCRAAWQPQDQPGGQPRGQQQGRRQASAYALEWVVEHLNEAGAADTAAALLADPAFILHRLRSAHGARLLARTVTETLQAGDDAAGELRRWRKFWSACEAIITQVFHDDTSSSEAAARFLQLAVDCAETDTEQATLRQLVREYKYPLPIYLNQPVRQQETLLLRSIQHSSSGWLRGVLVWGEKLISWGEHKGLGGTFRFWSQNGQPLTNKPIQAHSGGVNGLLPVGENLVSWGWDNGLGGTLRFWSLHGNEPLGGKPIQAHSGSVDGLLPVGENLVSWGGDTDLGGTLRFWSQKGAPLSDQPIQAHSHSVDGLLPVGENLVSWGWDIGLGGTLRFWSQNGEPLGGKPIPAHSGRMGGLLPVGENLISWGEDTDLGGTLRFWSLHGEPLPGKPIPAHSGGVNGLLPVGENLVSWGWDQGLGNTLRFWSLHGDEPRGGKLIPAHSGGVNGLLPVGENLVSWGGDTDLGGTLRFWSLHGQPLPGKPIPAHSGNVDGLLPVGENLVSWGGEEDGGTIRFWSRNGEPLHGQPFPAYSGGVKGLLPVGENLVSWGWEDEGGGTLRFWSQNGQPLTDQPIMAHTRSVSGILSVGENLVSWGKDEDLGGTIRFWSLHGDEPFGGQPIPAHSSRVDGLLPVGGNLVSWGWDIDLGYTLGFWSQNGQPLTDKRIMAHSVYVDGLLPVGGNLVSWGWDKDLGGTLRFWSQNGQPLTDQPIPAHSGGVGGLLPVGENLVSWGWDQELGDTLRFWSLHGDEPLGGKPVPAHSGRVRGLLPVGENLVSWGRDIDLGYTLRFWSMDGEPLGDPPIQIPGEARRLLPMGETLITQHETGLRFWSPRGKPLAAWFSPVALQAVAVLAPNRLAVGLAGDLRILHLDL